MNPAYLKTHMDLLVSGASALAQDITTLEKIGPVINVIKTDKTVTLNCSDNSQVQLSILAPISFAFAPPSPNQFPRKITHGPSLNQTGPHRAGISAKHRISSRSRPTELEVVVRRSPLLIEFRDARTHRVLNADERPMSYDAPVD
jgi:hypothetical protein